MHEGTYYLRNADGFVFRAPYQTATSFAEGMAGQNLTRLANPPSFNDILRRTVGAPPAGMADHHAHHILFRTGHGPAQQALVEEGQAILRRFNIDPIFGPENLVWAPNRVAGQHGIDALRNVVETLRQVEAAGGTYAEIQEALRRLGQVAVRRP